MAVKYRCTKCDRKFVEWGAEKVRAGEACEDCNGEYLEQVGHEVSKAPAKKKPALKRKKAKAAKETEPTPLASYDDDNTVAPDLNTLTGESVSDNVDDNEDYDDDVDDDDDEEPIDVDEDEEPGDDADEEE